MGIFGLPNSQLFTANTKLLCVNLFLRTANSLFIYNVVVQQENAIIFSLRWKFVLSSIVVGNWTVAYVYQIRFSSWPWMWNNLGWVLHFSVLVVDPSAQSARLVLDHAWHISRWSARSSSRLSSRPSIRAVLTLLGLVVVVLVLFDHICSKATASFVLNGDRWHKNRLAVYYCFNN